MLFEGRLEVLDEDVMAHFASVPLGQAADPLGQDQATIGHSVGHNHRAAIEGALGRFLQGGESALTYFFQGLLNRQRGLERDRWGGCRFGAIL